MVIFLDMAWISDKPTDRNIRYGQNVDSRASLVQARGHVSAATAPADAAHGTASDASATGVGASVSVAAVMADAQPQFPSIVRESIGKPVPCAAGLWGGLPSAGSLEPLECGRDDVSFFGHGFGGGEAKVEGGSGRVLLSFRGCPSCDVARDLACLPESRCLPRLQSERAARCDLAFAAALRRGLRSEAPWGPKSGDNIPLGKRLNYYTIDNWISWTSGGSSQRGGSLDSGEHGADADERYDTWLTRNFTERGIPYCQANGFSYMRCVLRPMNAAEAPDDLSPEECTILQHTRLAEEGTLVNEALRCRPRRDARVGSACGPMAELTLFTQLARMRLIREVPLIQACDKHCTEIRHRSADEAPGVPATSPRLKVGLHIRRGDSCWFRRDTPSRLNDPWQASSARYCYETSVYATALEALRNRYPGQLDTVLLSTDEAGLGGLLDDFRTGHSELFRSLNWRYLNFSRKAYDAPKRSMIEARDNVLYKGAKGDMSFSGLADLWHLSHADLFVGHLGSRYGKQAWYMAMGRKGHFVPYVSVDGHTICCTMMESCGPAMDLVHDMHTCLTFKQGQRDGLSKELMMNGRQ